MRSLLLIVVVALVVRLAVMSFVYPERTDPYRDHWRFGGEIGRIARSIVEGKGYSSPMFADTGPTAWVPPLYPSILALVFASFGVYTKTSAIVMLSLNCLFSAMTCLPVYAMANRTFGERQALWSAWAWALFPYGIYFSADFIWPTILATLLLPTGFWLGLRMLDSESMGAWAGYGAVGALGALNDPIVLTVLVPMGLWCSWRAWKQQKPLVRLSVAAGLAFCVVVSPWFIRNYGVFHRVVPFRSNFGLELYSGNSGSSLQLVDADLMPSHSDREWQEYVAVGEMRYMQHKQQQAKEYIASHPGQFVRRSLRRVVYMWTGFWSLDPEYLKGEPFDIPAIFLNTALSALALLGLRWAWKDSVAAMAPYAIALFCFPLPYYITHTEDYFRRPMDPIFVVLAVYAVMEFRRRCRLAV